MDRILVSALIQRFFEPRLFIQVVAGPRQIGKTTAVLSALKKSGLDYAFHSGDEASPPSRSWLETVWQNARVRIKAKDLSQLILAIDEIQQIEDWSRTVKALWDEDSRTGTQIQVVILGSATLLIQQGLSESLMGRYEQHHLWHWSYAEMKQSFDWTPEQYVWFGGYPGSAALSGNATRWKSYIRNSLIEASLSKDVLSMARIHKPAVLRRLFELGCAYSSQVVSYGKMLGQLDDAGNTTTLASYLELLDAAGLLGGLEKYAGTAIRKRGSSPKFQVHNNALMTATRSESFTQIQAMPELWGRFVESAVGAHLLGESKRIGFELGYWKQGDAEVDFVVTKEGRSVGIEVKSNASRKNAGMDLFKKAHPQAKLILVGSAGISWQEFLAMDVGVLFE